MVGEVGFFRVVAKEKKLVRQIIGGFADNAGWNAGCRGTAFNLSCNCTLFGATREGIEEDGGGSAAPQFKSLVGISESEIDLLRSRFVAGDVRRQDAVEFVSDVFQQLPPDVLESEIEIGKTECRGFPSL